MARCDRSYFAPTSAAPRFASSLLTLHFPDEWAFLRGAQSVWAVECGLFSHSTAHKTEHLISEADTDVLRVGSDCAVKLAFHGATVGSDAGLFPYRDLDEALGLSGWLDWRSCPRLHGVR